MVLSFQGVSKIFGDQTRALDDVSFTLNAGEFVFLVGPSGAGKTTIMRLVVRHLLPSQGSIHIGEMDVGKLPKSRIPLLRRKIGMVFQDFKVLSDRTVFENIAIALEILGKSEHEIEKKVMEVLGLVGLDRRMRYFPTQLSAGELQRIAIARAIVAGP
ncbi:MAG: ATP-binding cassette domain-containing protein, partial [Patescibacteria group bacterium]